MNLDRKQKVSENGENLSYLFFKSKAFTKLFWKNQFADCLEGPGSGGQASFGTDLQEAGLLY